jgi:cytochrome c5
MADPHFEEHDSLIKTPQQLIAVVLAAFLVPIAGILLIVQLVTGGLQVDRDSPAMSEEAVAQRLKPVGEVAIGEAPAMPAAPMAGSPATAGGGAGVGQKTYEAACAMCHMAAVAGAPKFGDKAAWSPRIAQGKDVLYTSAIKGKNLMPAKGGAASLPDGDVRAAVDYMVSQAK